MRSIRPLLFACLIGTAFAVPALAQPAPPSQYPSFPCKTPTDAQQNDAHTLYTAGKKRFDVAEYDKALALFIEAYAADCTKHELLIIIARAYELKGNKVEAVIALETYVKRVPTAPDLDTHRLRIENMKREIAAATPTVTAPATNTTATTALPPPTSTATAPPPEENGHTALPWVLVGVGGVALVTGIILYVVGNSNFPAGCDASDGTCTNYYDSPASAPYPNGGPASSTDKPAPNCSPPNGDSSNDGCLNSGTNKTRQQNASTDNGLRQAGPIVAIGGGVLIAGGLLWHFLEPTGPKKSGNAPTWHLLPVATPNYGGVGLGGSF